MRALASQGGKGFGNGGMRVDSPSAQISGLRPPVLASQGGKDLPPSSFRLFRRPLKSSSREGWAATDRTQPEQPGLQRRKGGRFSSPLPILFNGRISEKCKDTSSRERGRPAQ